jgi:protein TonB
MAGVMPGTHRHPGPVAGGDRSSGASRRRYRNAGLIALTAVAHIIAVGVLSRRANEVHLMSEAAPAARGSVSVTLVSAPHPPVPVAAPPVPVPVPPPVAKPVPVPEKPVTPRHQPKVIATDRPAVREVAKVAPRTIAAPVPPPVTPPPQPAAPAATAAAPSSAAPTPAPSSVAPPKGLPDASAELALPKPIGTNQMGKLGCRIPAPEYPARSRRLSEEGTVLLKVTIGSDGRVQRAQVQTSSGYPTLDDAASRAVALGKCEPYLDAGRATAVTTLQPITFHLND